MLFGLVHIGILMGIKLFELFYFLALNEMAVTINLIDNEGGL